jgi:hypothetical protein
VQAQLQTLYGSVDNVELFVGGLAENHAAGSSIGSTFGAIIADQFQRVRDGDRLWYQNIFSGSDLKGIQNTTLADLIRENTTTTNVQNKVFDFQPTISGRVIVSLSGAGGHGGIQIGLPGILVNLEDSSGNVVATTHTTQGGNYTFSGMSLGTYRVSIVTPSKLLHVVQNDLQVGVTTGAASSPINFSLRLNLGSSGNPGNQQSDPPATGHPGSGNGGGGGVGGGNTQGSGTQGNRPGGHSDGPSGRR